MTTFIDYFICGMSNENCIETDIYNDLPIYNGEISSCNYIYYDNRF